MTYTFQLIVFDWEGTISDTLGPLFQLVSLEAQKLGYGAIDPYQARQYVHLGLVKALRKLYPALSEKEEEQLIQATEQGLSAHHTAICLIPGVLEFIQSLHRAKKDLAIATNKGAHSLTKALEASGLDAFFKITRSAGQVPAKPCPQMLIDIMEAFNQTPENTLMIGDSISDIEMAKRLDVTAIGMDFYRQQEAALKTTGAIAVFDDYRLLSHFLRIS